MAIEQALSQADQERAKKIGEALKQALKSSGVGYGMESTKEIAAVDGSKYKALSDEDKQSLTINLDRQCKAYPLEKTIIGLAVLEEQAQERLKNGKTEADKTEATESLKMTRQQMEDWAINGPQKMKDYVNKWREDHSNPDSLKTIKEQNQKFDKDVENARAREAATRQQKTI